MLPVLRALRSRIRSSHPNNPKPELLGTPMLGAGLSAARYCFFFLFVYPGASLFVASRVRHECLTYRSSDAPPPPQGPQKRRSLGTPVRGWERWWLLQGRILGGSGPVLLGYPDYGALIGKEASSGCAGGRRRRGGGDAGELQLEARVLDFHS